MARKRKPATLKNSISGIPLLLSIGFIKRPSKSQIEELIEFRAMDHETLGRLIDTQLRKYLIAHAGEEALAKAKQISAEIGNKKCSKPKR